MKTNRSMKVAIIVIALTLITSCFVGTTFAKYSSTGVGTATGTVAAWEINLTDEEGTKNIATTSTFTVDLFAHEDANVDADVIAPGTTGSFAFTLTNAAEVTAKYKVTFAETTDLAPIQFSLTGTDGWTNDISALDFNGGESDDFTEIAIGATSNQITIYWKWDFDGDHTALGIAAADDGQTTPTCVVTITVNAEQVD